MRARLFAMAGGGTGGHVIPALAVARELRRRGHEVVFFGTARGLESRLVPAEGFPLELIRIGGLKSVGLARRLKTLFELPVSVLGVAAWMGRRRPAAVFSMGGYVAGPTVAAAALRGVPLVVMEPNAVPGFTNRRIGRFVRRALISFPETARYFPSGRTERTGLPVREEFFSLEPRQPDGQLRVLVTGGSQGSRTLNRAVLDCWPILRASGASVRFLHQTGRAAHDEVKAEFARVGVAGECVPFIDHMPQAFAAADLVVCRSGAGAVAELAAAGKPSVLVPFPFASDNHQFHNAEALAKAGAARLVEDKDLSGERLAALLTGFQQSPEALAEMGRNARGFAQPGAAARAASILEDAA